MSCKREGNYKFTASSELPHILVGACHLDPDEGHGMQVSLGIGSSESGHLTRYFTTQQARALAVLLVQAADFYDAETDRIAQETAALNAELDRK